LNEGIAKEKIFYVGNVMIDTLLKLKVKSKKLKVYEKFGVGPKEYAVLTLHRPENVDNKKTLKEILKAIEEIQKRIKIIYPIHPRTKKRIKEFGFQKLVKKMKNLVIKKPLSYLEMLSLMKNAKLVLTDSGGIQEETTVLGVPCLTLRKTTERPITIEVGTNKVVGSRKEDIIKESLKILDNKAKKGKVPKYWDGKTAKRIIKTLRNYGRKK